MFSLIDIEKTHRNSVVFMTANFPHKNKQYSWLNTDFSKAINLSNIVINMPDASCVVVIEVYDKLK